MPVPWVFSSSPGKWDEVRSALLWFKDGWKEPRPARVGGIFMEYGGSYTMIESMPWICRQWGWEFIGAELVPMTAVDTTTEWMRLMGKKPDVLYNFLCGPSAVAGITDCNRLGYNKVGVPLLHTYPASVTLCL